MKIAFCLHGIIGGVSGKNGSGGDIDYTKCYEKFKEFIFDRYDTDVFLHTWSIQHSKNLNKIYQPKSALYELQKIFKVSEPFAIDKFNSLSRWCSTQKVLNLQNEYGQKNNIQYDYIMITRFDLIWLVPLKFEELEKDCFYVPNWNLAPKSKTKRENISRPIGKASKYSDMWFIGNQEQINHLSNLYDVVEELGDEEYNPHKLVFAHMFEKYGSGIYESGKIRFKYYNSFDFALYRKYIIGDYR